MENKNIRKLGKVAGKSYTVTLPIEIVRRLGWQENQKLVVTQEGNRIMIEDWKEDK